MHSSSLILDIWYHIRSWYNLKQPILYEALRIGEERLQSHYPALSSSMLMWSLWLGSVGNNHNTTMEGADGSCVGWHVKGVNRSHTSKIVQILQDRQLGSSEGWIHPGLTDPHHSELQGSCVQISKVSIRPSNFKKKLCYLCQMLLKC